MRIRLHIAVLMLGLACGTTASAQVAVIAHKDVPVDSLTKVEVLDFYTGDVLSWGGGLEVVVYDLQLKGMVKDAFYAFLGRSSSRMKSIWLKRKLAGEGDPPESFQTEEELLQHVASTPGAIGFVHPSKVTDSVKVLVEIDNGEG